MTDVLGETRSDAERLQQSGFLLRAGLAIGRGDRCFRDVLDILPAAIYITDAAGQITYYNDAAAVLWGHRPALGEAQWCGSWKLYWPDGRPLPHDQCPMAMALRDGLPNRGLEAVAERPDGTRIPFLPYPTPLHDEAGSLIGAVNMLIDISDRKRGEESAERLAAIVECSDDAIISKSLDGIITSWNRGAERLFGYTAVEMIGKPVLLLIPAARQNEEEQILASIRRGDRIDHYETIRRRKDGSLVEISLTVSPVRDAAGRIAGASKIARDITERRRAEEQQKLLLREMDHRVKNLFALAGGVVSLSARSAKTSQELVSAVQQRLGALARAHSLTLPKISEAPNGTDHTTTLHALIRAIALPFDNRTEEKESRVAIKGPDIPIIAGAVTSLALLLHEFATNAAKYGALSTPDGAVEIECAENGKQFVLIWKEHGGPSVIRQTDGDGFGSLLTRLTVKDQLNGDIAREWAPDGLMIRLTVARDRI